MSKAQLDHIIILVPYLHLASIPASFSSAFKISPGGRHADNKTENRLILLKDGVYLELIAFVNDDGALREGHWWGNLPNGVIDFALTSRSVEDVNDVRHRLTGLKSGVGLEYDQPRAGARKRDDGVEVKWFVTFPKGASDSIDVRRGSVPFWCHDVTDRELRVPVNREGAVDHPSGAVGVKEIVVGVPRGRLQDYEATYSAIVGMEGKTREDGTVAFEAGTPFGKSHWGAIVLEEHGEEEARVVRLVLGVDGPSGNDSGINEAYSGGNKIRIDFSSN